MKRRTLDDDLRELERADPTVRDAVRKYDAVVAKITGRTLDDRERVLSAIRGILAPAGAVAPVDPEAVICAVLSTFDNKIRGPLGWSNYTTSERAALVAAMRVALDRAGVPVT